MPYPRHSTPDCLTGLYRWELETHSDEGVKVGILVGINIAHEYSKVLSGLAAEYSPLISQYNSHLHRLLNLTCSSLTVSFSYIEFSLSL